MFRFLFKLILFTAFFQTTLFADEVKVFEFTDKELSELTVRKVRGADNKTCLLYTSPSPRDQRGSRMPSSA